MKQASKSILNRFNKKLNIIQFIYKIRYTDNLSERLCVCVGIFLSQQ